MAAELRQMRYFVAVAEHRSFTRAAADVYVAQQALSQQVKALEEAVGVKLLERTSRRVELTAAGAAYLEDCRRVLAAARRAEERARAVADGTAGRLRLAYTLATAYDTVPLFINDLTRRFPKLKISAREVFAGDVCRLVREGHHEIAIAPETGYPDELAQHRIRLEPFVLAVSEHHRLAGARVVSLRQFRGETFQLWSREMAPGYYDAVIAACHAAGFAPTVDESGSGTIAWANIAAGRGVNLVVASLAVQLPRGITLLKLDDPGAVLPVSAVHRAGQGHPALARFIDSCVQLGRAQRWLPAASPAT